MGKQQARRKHRNKQRRRQQQCTNGVTVAPLIGDGNGATAGRAGASSSTILVAASRIRHGDARVRHGALAALSSGLFSPESLLGGHCRRRRGGGDGGNGPCRKKNKSKKKSKKKKKGEKATGIRVSGGDDDNKDDDNKDGDGDGDDDDDDDAIDDALLRAVTERILDDDYPVATCAAGCVSNYLSFYGGASGGGGDDDDDDDGDYYHDDGGAALEEALSWSSSSAISKSKRGGNGSTGDAIASILLGRIERENKEVRNLICALEGIARAEVEANASSSSSSFSSLSSKLRKQTDKGTKMDAIMEGSKSTSVPMPTSPSQSHHHHNHRLDNISGAMNDDCDGINNNNNHDKDKDKENDADEKMENAMVASAAVVSVGEDANDMDEEKEEKGENNKNTIETDRMQSQQHHQQDGAQHGDANKKTKKKKKKKKKKDKKRKNNNDESIFDLKGAAAAATNPGTDANVVSAIKHFNHNHRQARLGLLRSLSTCTTVLSLCLSGLCSLIERCPSYVDRLSHDSTSGGGRGDNALLNCLLETLIVLSPCWGVSFSTSSLFGRGNDKNENVGVGGGGGGGGGSINGVMSDGDDPIQDALLRAARTLHAALDENPALATALLEWKHTTTNNNKNENDVDIKNDAMNVAAISTMPKSESAPAAEALRPRTGPEWIAFLASSFDIAHENGMKEGIAATAAVENRGTSHPHNAATASASARRLPASAAMHCAGSLVALRHLMPRIALSSLSLSRTPDPNALVRSIDDLIRTCALPSLLRVISYYSHSYSYSSSLCCSSSLSSSSSFVSATFFHPQNAYHCIMELADAKRHVRSMMEDEEMETQIIRAVRGRKESARSIARRQKLMREEKEHSITTMEDIDKTNKTDNAKVDKDSMVATETNVEKETGTAVKSMAKEARGMDDNVNGNGRDDKAKSEDDGDGNGEGNGNGKDGGRNMEDATTRHERALRTWRKQFVLPIRLALEISADILCAAGGAQDDGRKGMDGEDDDDDDQVMWDSSSPSSSSVLLVQDTTTGNLHETKTASAILSEWTIQSGLPDALLAFLQSIVSFSLSFVHAVTAEAEATKEAATTSGSSLPSEPSPSPSSSSHNLPNLEMRPGCDEAAVAREGGERPPPFDIPHDVELDLSDLMSKASSAVGNALGNLIGWLPDIDVVDGNNDENGSAATATKIWNVARMMCVEAAAAAAAAAVESGRMDRRNGRDGSIQQQQEEKKGGGGGGGAMSPPHGSGSSRTGRKRHGRIPAAALAASASTMLAALRHRSSSTLRLVGPDELNLILSLLSFGTDSLAVPSASYAPLTSGNIVKGGPNDLPPIPDSNNDDDEEEESKAAADVRRDAASMLGLLGSAPHSTDVNDAICVALLSSLNRAEYEKARVTSEVLGALMDLYGPDDDDPNGHGDVFRKHNVLDAFVVATPYFVDRIRKEGGEEGGGYNVVDAEEVESWKECAMNAGRFVKYKRGQMM